MTEPASPLEYDETPLDLHRPVLVVAFSGWNDAAESATTAAKFLTQIRPMKRLAVIQPEEFYHFGLTRPEVRFSKDMPNTREVHWPTTVFQRNEEPSPRDMIVGTGVEPHLKWQTFCRLILDLARRAQVSLVVTLGALVADVPHTRPVRISGVAHDPELARRLQTSPTRYEGPTGILGVLGDVCRRAGIPAVSLWANIPHYISEVHNPHAVLALVHRVLEILEWEADVAELTSAAAEFDRQLKRIMDQKPEVRKYVEELEQRDEQDTTPPGVEADLPSTAELIREAERLLRRRRGDADSTT